MGNLILLWHFKKQLRHCERNAVERSNLFEERRMFFKACEQLTDCFVPRNDDSCRVPK